MDSAGLIMVVGAKNYLVDFMTLLRSFSRDESSHGHFPTPVNVRESWKKSVDSANLLTIIAKTHSSPLRHPHADFR